MNSDPDFGELNERVNRAYNTDCFDARDFSNWIRNMSPEELGQLLDQPSAMSAFPVDQSSSLSPNPASSCGEDEEDEEDEDDVEIMFEQSSNDFVCFSSDFQRNHSIPYLSNADHVHHPSSPLTQSSSSFSVFGQAQPLSSTGLPMCPSIALQPFHRACSPELKSGQSFAQTNHFSSFASALSNQDWAGQCVNRADNSPFGQPSSVAHPTTKRAIDPSKRKTFDNLPTIQLALDRNENDFLRPSFDCRPDTCQENLLVNNFGYTSQCNGPAFGQRVDWATFSSSLKTTKTNDGQQTRPQSHPTLDCFQTRRMRYQIDPQLFIQLEKLLTNVWVSLQCEYSQRNQRPPGNQLTSSFGSLCSPDSSSASSTNTDIHTTTSSSTLNAWSMDSGCVGDESTTDEADSTMDEDSDMEEDRDERYGGISATPGGRKQIKLWQFLLHLLDDQRFGQVVGWLDESTGVFRIHQTRLLSQMWGLVKGRPAMNYDKLSRSMRQYYNRRILVKPVKSTRLVYTFHGEFLLKKRYRVWRKVPLNSTLFVLKTYSHNCFVNFVKNVPALISEYNFVQKSLSVFLASKLTPKSSSQTVFETGAVNRFPFVLANVGHVILFSFVWWLHLASTLMFNLFLSFSVVAVIIFLSAYAEQIKSRPIYVWTWAFVSSFFSPVDRF